MSLLDRGEQTLNVALQLTHLQTQLPQPEGSPLKYGRMEAPTLRLAHASQPLVANGPAAQPRCYLLHPRVVLRNPDREINRFGSRPPDTDSRSH